MTPLFCVSKTLMTVALSDVPRFNSLSRGARHYITALPEKAVSGSYSIIAGLREGYFLFTMSSISSSSACRSSSCSTSCCRIVKAML